MPKKAKPRMPKKAKPEIRKKAKPKRQASYAEAKAEAEDAEEGEAEDAEEGEAEEAEADDAEEGEAKDAAKVSRSQRHIARLAPLNSPDHRRRADLRILGRHRGPTAGNNNTLIISIRIIIIIEELR